MNIEHVNKRTRIGTLPVSRLLRASVLSVMALAAVGVAYGCGGGSHAVGPGASIADVDQNTGALRFYVKWPEQTAQDASAGGTTRIIPPSAARIKVVVEKVNGGKLAERLLTRPASVGQTGQLDITNVPAGTVKVTATAYPDPIGGGQGAYIAQAVGAVVLTVRAGQRTTETLTMNSTVTTVQLIRLAGGGTGADSTTLTVGEQQLFVAVARDAKGRVVVTDPNEWLWNAYAGGGRTADFRTEGQTATITGLAPGEASLQVLFLGVELGVQEPPFADLTLTVRNAIPGSGSLEIPVQ